MAHADEHEHDADHEDTTPGAHGEESKKLEDATASTTDGAAAKKKRKKKSTAPSTSSSEGQTRYNLRSRIKEFQAQ
jgi:hypothetical protein